MNTIGPGGPSRNIALDVMRRFKYSGDMCSASVLKTETVVAELGLDRRWQCHGTCYSFQRSWSTLESPADGSPSSKEMVLCYSGQ